MKVSRIEANWISSKILSDAVREREQSAARRTAWLVFLYPSLAHIRPTERVMLLRDARNCAALEPLTLLAAITSIVLLVVFYIVDPSLSHHSWLDGLAGLIGLGSLITWHVRIRAILRTAARSSEDDSEGGSARNA